MKSHSSGYADVQPLLLLLLLLLLFEDINDEYETTLVETDTLQETIQLLIKSGIKR